MSRALAAVVAATAPSAAGASSGIPETGSYRYAAAGVDRGPAGASNRVARLPGRATFVVARASGGYTATLRVGSRHLEASRFRVDADGAWEVSRRIDIGRPAQPRPVDRLAPQPLHLPRLFTVGASWPFDYRLNGSRERGSGRVLRAERLVVEGQAVEVVVIILRTTTTGLEAGSRREVIWWDASRALAVRTILAAHRTGTQGYRTRLRLDLMSLTPGPVGPVATTIRRW